MRLTIPNDHVRTEMVDKMQRSQGEPGRTKQERRIGKCRCMAKQSSGETSFFFFFRVLHTNFPTCLCPLCHCGQVVAYRPRLVDGRRGGGPSSVATRSRNPPTGRRRDSPISSSLFSPHAHPCAHPNPSRQRPGHLQSHFDGGWNVWQAVFPEPPSAAACRRVERRDCAHEALPRLQSARKFVVCEFNALCHSQRIHTFGM